MVRKSDQTREKLEKYYKKRSDIDKTIEKLEKSLREQENTEAGDIVRSYHLTIEELAELLGDLKGHLPETENEEEKTETYEETY